jgi:hypothetical protein
LSICSNTGEQIDSAIPSSGGGADLQPPVNVNTGQQIDIQATYPVAH